MDVRVGDKILVKAASLRRKSFDVLRVGMDFKIRCTGCGREVMLPPGKDRKTLKRSCGGES